MNGSHTSVATGSCMRSKLTESTLGPQRRFTKMRLPRCQVSRLTLYGTSPCSGFSVALGYQTDTDQSSALVTVGVACTCCTPVCGLDTTNLSFHLCCEHRNMTPSAKYNIIILTLIISILKFSVTNLTKRL